MMTTTMYVVARPKGRWEARESFRTESGPRSRTLASFRELDDEAIDRIKERSSVPVDIDELRRMAVRAGAPTISEPDRLAARLTREIALARRPSKNYLALLAGSLSDRPELPDHLESMSMWAGATLEERSEAVVDLLRVGSAFPPVDWEERNRRPRFPRIKSS